MAAIRILFLGDVVGEPGRKAVIEQLPLLKQSEGLDFCIVNGENSAGGKGITPKIAIDLLRAGAAVITTGDHVWDQQEIVDYFPTEPRLLRPLNYPEGTPGAGSVVLETAKGRVGVIQAQGRSFIQPPLENPYLAVEKEVERLRADGVMAIVLDYHAETTSEKIAMGRMLDGKVSLVVGTHTHVQTADENDFSRRHRLSHRRRDVRTRGIDPRKEHRIGRLALQIRDAHAFSNRQRTGAIVRRDRGRGSGNRHLFGHPQAVDDGAGSGMFRPPDPYIFRGFG